MHDTSRSFLEPFSDPAAVARYAEGPPRFVPGFSDLHRMTGILLAERAPRDARILVLGAGGGLELKALADAYPRWRFVGVDPAAEMLKLAEKRLMEQAASISLHQGYIDDAPEGPFDGAVCLLTLHFLGAAERQRTVGQIHRRLVRRAPFVAAHSSFPQAEGERELWLSRYRDFAIASGVDPKQADNARAAVSSNLALYSPEEDAEILRAAGFREVQQFYAALSWRGWVAYA